MDPKLAKIVGELTATVKLVSDLVAIVAAVANRIEQINKGDEPTDADLAFLRAEREAAFDRARKLIG